MSDKLVSAALIATFTLALACGSKRDEAASSTPDHVYQVRGVIQRLPGPPDQLLYVHHEAIDDFVDREGKVSGMMSMSMLFGLRPGISADGLEVGDAIEMTIEVRWQGRPILQIASLRELPAGTELEPEFIPQQPK